MIAWEKSKDKLADVIDHARSLDKIRGWLVSQKFIRAVVINDYLLKSNPPQRDIVIEIANDDGTTSEMIENIIDFGNNKFKFRELRGK